MKLPREGGSVEAHEYVLANWRNIINVDLLGAGIRLLFASFTVIPAVVNGVETFFIGI